MPSSSRTSSIANRLEERAGSAVALSCVDLGSALSVGQEAWDRLALSHPFPSVYMSWAWHEAWFHESSDEERSSAFVLTDLAADRPGGPGIILPLSGRTSRFHRLAARALEWSAADVGTADHLDLLCDPDLDYGALADALDRRPWHLLRLANVTEGLTRIEPLLRALEQRGHSTAVEPLWACAQIHLPSTWEEYLSGLSSSRRYRIRKDERDLRARHEVAIRDFGANNLEEGWSHFVRLHHQRWDDGGVLRDVRLAAVYRRFLRNLSDQGGLGFLGLEIDGEIAAVDFWAEFGGVMFGIQSGRDPRWDRSSVGRVLRGIALQEVISRGLTVADFSRGLDDYKREWCSDERWCYDVYVFRKSIRGYAWRAWRELVTRTRVSRRALGSRS